jgi:hypothetical protein
LIGRVGTVATIIKFLRPTDSDSFDPEALKALGKAYDMALAALHDAGQPELVQEVIARRIIKPRRKANATRRRCARSHLLRSIPTSQCARPPQKPPAGGKQKRAS